LSGGSDNDSLGYWAVVGGGEYNSSSASYGTIGGGLQNSTTADYSTVAGGSGNASTAFAGFIGGGSANWAGGEGATIPGGVYNEARGHYSAIGGGFLNMIHPNADHAVVSGGFSNVVVADVSVIGGGLRNTIHTNAWSSSVISGGARNVIQPFSQYCTIGGGDNNLVESNGWASVIGGGTANTIQTRATYSFIGGGFNNYIWSNTLAATVAGGYINFIRTNATSAAIGGGQYNTVEPNATHATIPGGFQNTVAAPFTFAEGNHDSANHSGAFVWSDSSSSNAFASTAPNQFLIRASGGVGIGTRSPGTALHVTGLNSQLRLEDPTFNFHWNIYTETLGNFASSGNLLFVSSSGVYGYIRRTDGAYFASSDARLKKDVQGLSNMLDRVLQLRPVSYRFKSAPASASRTVGLIAQEVQPHFPEVVDEHEGMKSVAYAALVPVALGAIQELNQKLETEVARHGEAIDAANAEIDTLKTKNAALEERLQRLEALLPTARDIAQQK
jgi:hypothetical protein